MAIQFNSIDQDRFNANSVEFSTVEKERAHLITCGRLLMAERNGRDMNALRDLENKPHEYTPMMADGGENGYAQTNRNLQRKMMLYSAARCCAQTGEVAPHTYEDFLKNQRRFMSNSHFLHVLSGIVQDIISPILPVTMSNALGWLAETVSVPLGQTYELDVMSNDIFLFEDDSWGASRSKPSNYLYTYPITLNPRLRTAKATIKWYQLVGNDADLGRWFNSMAAGLYSKIVALWSNAMKAATDDTFFTPSGLQFTNSSANWVTAAEKVSYVNGTQYRNVVAFGAPSALSKALPSGIVNASSVNLDAALATMLGVDWAKYGYMGEYMGVRLMPLYGSIVPGTQNSTVTNLIPNDKVWMFPVNGYKPVYVGMEEGGEFSLQLTPSETADMTIDILVSCSLDAQPVMANKGAVITM